MAISKEEYLSAERRNYMCQQAIFVQKDEADATRLIISSTEPEEENVIWIKPVVQEQNNQNQNS